MASSGHGTGAAGLFGVGGTLLYQLLRRELKQRYVGSILGWLWSVIHPCVLLAVYSIVFRRALGIKLPPDEAHGSYAAFLLAGLLPWLFFSETLTRSATSIVEYSTLIKRSVFPPQAVPAGIAASAAVTHSVSVVLLLLGAGLSFGLPQTLVALPLYTLLLACFSLGAALAAAALQVYVRDTAQVLAVALTLWFWCTPVFLPESYYQGRLGAVLDWNPLRYAVRGYRESILGGAWPDPVELAVLGGFSLASFVAGAAFFRRAKGGFADVL